MEYSTEEGLGALFTCLEENKKKIFKHYASAHYNAISEAKLKAFYDCSSLEMKKHPVLFHTFFLKQLREPGFYQKTQCDLAGKKFPALLMAYYQDILLNPDAAHVWGNILSGEAHIIQGVLTLHLQQALLKNPGCVLSSGIGKKLKKIINQQSKGVKEHPSLSALDAGEMAEITALLESIMLQASVAQVRQANQKLDGQSKRAPKALSL